MADEHAKLEPSSDKLQGDALHSVVDSGGGRTQDPKSTAENANEPEPQQQPLK